MALCWDLSPPARWLDVGLGVTLELLGLLFVSLLVGICCPQLPLAAGAPFDCFEPLIGAAYRMFAGLVLALPSLDFLPKLGLFQELGSQFPN